MATYEPINGDEYECEKTRKNVKCSDYERRCGDRDLEAALHISRPLPSASAGGGNAGPKAVEKERLVSLDVFRGLTVALMILVDDVGGVLPAINHSPWNGATLADFVMPFFLFIVGVSLAFAYKNVPCKYSATRKAALRTLKLLLLGLFLQGGFFHGIKSLSYGVDVERIRWMGILQRIAIAYLVAALCEIWLKEKGHVDSKLSLIRKYILHWGVACLITTIYLFLIYGLYVPDWEYQIPIIGSQSASRTIRVKCGVRGDTGPGCNAVGMIDRKILGLQHLYRKPIYSRTKHCSMNSPGNGAEPPDAPSWCQAPFDPEGVLSSMMAIVTCLIGLHFGHIIIHSKEPKKRINKWLILSFSLLALGLFLDLFGMHVNKPLYSVSYTCITSGAAGFLFVGIYMMVDMYGYRRATLVFEWMGIHALTIYVLAACNVLFLVIRGFYWKTPENNILGILGIGR